MKLREIQIRQAEVRARLSTLSEATDWEEAQTTEAGALRTELRNLDERLAAALASQVDVPAAGGDDDSAGDSRARQHPRTGLAG